MIINKSYFVKILFYSLLVIILSLPLSCGNDDNPVVTKHDINDLNISIYLVEGLYAKDTIIADGTTKIKFNIRHYNNSSGNVWGMTNGFKLYSPDGANWNNSKIDTTSNFDWSIVFDLVIQTNVFSNTGQNADTVALGCATVFSKGFIVDTEITASYIEIGPIEKSNHGKIICVDSTYYPPAGEWKWAYKDNSGTKYISPTWGGPYCFTIVNPAMIAM